MDVLILTSKNKVELIKKLKKHSFNYVKIISKEIFFIII